MSGTRFIETGQRVIRAEADALSALADALDKSFDTVIAQLIETKGRVIVTGIGKSGHIARKIAATFASTGTPAQFVHPAEANHGDLGMITRDDLVLAISNSGEAPELVHIISFTRRFAIPLIALTSRAQSTLAQEADTVLLIPALGEACGTGVVPTNSTTMTLALGDALAVALMEHRAFTAEHFREFHPGGKLGAQLSRVRDLMHDGEALPLVSEDTAMSEALLEISQKSFGIVGVLDPTGKLVGVVTDGDLRRNMEGLLDKSARDVMTKAPKVIGPDALAQEALGMMTGRILCLFVTEDERPVGLIHIHDCLRVGLG